MSDFDSLREDLLGISESFVRHAETQNRLFDAQERSIALLWEDNAELRDELHALANRVEALTRAVMADPAEVAERMIFTCRLNPGCNVSRPHIHQEDGAVIYVSDAATADNQLGQRAVVQAIRRNDQEPA